MRISREALERYQVLMYASALLGGAACGLLAPDPAGWLERLVWPVLAALLYATFCHVRASDALQAFRHWRFFAASLVANFGLVPILVWVLASLLPPDPALRLGVFMVLLVPCTDWFVTFTHLGQGSTRLAVAVVPAQLLVQLALLPVYLWLFLGPGLIAVATEPFLQAFVGLIAVPFGLAALTRRWAGSSALGAHWLALSVSSPVLLLAITIFLIAASQAWAFVQALSGLGWAALVFLLYVLVAAPLARLLALAFRLDLYAGRTLAFNLGSRNSFVVLPLALALPPGWDAAVASIVLQGALELAGLLCYLRWVPGVLFRGEQLQQPGERVQRVPGAE